LDLSENVVALSSEVNKPSLVPITILLPIAVMLNAISCSVGRNVQFNPPLAVLQNPLFSRVD
jgi:hypothetical protein